jgi:cytochrome c2
MLASAACARDEPRATTAPDQERGRALIAANGCGACHTIGGVDGANGLVGPPLDGIALRSYLAGYVPNTRENLAIWIRSPQSIKPGSAMPDLGLSRRDAEDIAAFLYSRNRASAP